MCILSQIRLHCNEQESYALLLVSHKLTYTLQSGQIDNNNELIIKCAHLSSFNS